MSLAGDTQSKNNRICLLKMSPPMLIWDSDQFVSDEQFQSIWGAP